PLAAFNRTRDVLTTDGGLDHILDVTDREPVTSNRLAVYLNVREVPLRDAPRIHTPRARHRLQRPLDLLANPLDLVEIRSEDLDPDGCFDSCQQHVQSVADRLRPDVWESGKLEGRVHVTLQLLECHALPPLFARLQ